ncbi:MAG: hypothetical protein MZV63_41125 [Marinilabiliales bacterium]|nr:hypothetical protein [Marinilabiliales bacterium]
MAEGHRYSGYFIRADLAWGVDSGYLLPTHLLSLLQSRLLIAAMIAVMLLKDEITAKAQALLPELIEIRRHIHRHP